ncbi:MAG: hypothetical protein Ct9H300mP31_03920 [Acidimicrobiaceae bacterium]|nr:MAG: hypothetical protein Ct9H300mP31_03920 [Acidimicrobiaceae bacterium]
MAPVVHRLVDQAVGDLLDRTFGQHLGQPLVTQLIEEAVAAQQVPVTVDRYQVPAVDQRISLDAQGPGQDIALRMAGRFLGGDLPGPH